MGNSRIAAMAALIPSSAIALVLTTCAASAEVIDQQNYHLPVQPLATSLRAVALASGRSIVAPAAVVSGKTAPALDGTFTSTAAVSALLEGSGLHSRIVAEGLVIEPDDTKAPQERVPIDGRSAASDIVVTGSRIRGAPVASPIISIGQEQIRDAGQATLAEVVRSLPQSFGGGQNPGVGNNVPATSGINVGGATSINLRGIGSDATLTLLNGHRLSYSASRQAIDVSSIPLGAIDRIEIVPDGASALYGSDAVAGVANIVLKPDYDGIETGARLGSSTDGGDFEQRYDAVAGHRWDTGGFIATFEFGRDTQILGKDRSYTQDRPALTLFPALKNYSATLSAHQRLTDRLSVEVDALFNKRFDTSAYALNAAGDVTQSGILFSYAAPSFAIAPTLRWSAGGDWRAFLTGSYGQDHTAYALTIYSAGVARLSPDNCYCNHATSIELGGDGTLVRLPAGPLKLAIGTGYRSNTLVRYNGEGAATNLKHAQDSYYGYGELSVPLISSEQGVAFVNALSTSAALRYERYPGIGHIVTPKLGLIYAPTADFDIKGSWGKSFRSPTLYQQYAARNVVLGSPDEFGGTGYAPDATAIVLEGGNPDLKPETATTWSATLDLHPRVLSGARLALSYFSVHYRNRIVTPIAYESQALSNPIYSDRLLADPGSDFLASIIASAASFGSDIETPYDPTKVAVFIDNSNVNAGRQVIRGADALLSYRTELGGPDDSLSATVDAAYLDSNQQLAEDQPVTQLAGTIFNPAHFRIRGGITWDRRPLTLSVYVNHSGGVSDTRLAPVAKVGSFSTVDLAARFRTGRSGILSQLDLTASVQNAFNAKPPAIRTTAFYDAPYDSTNASAIGRFVSLAVSKKW